MYFVIGTGGKMKSGPIIKLCLNGMLSIVVLRCIFALF